MVADLVARQPAMPDADQILRGLEERFEILSDVLDRRQGQAMEHGQALFRDLERRLDDVVARLDTPPPPPPEFDDSGIMQVIDQRFAEFARKLDVPAPEFDDTGIMQAIDMRFAELTSKLESRGEQSAANEGAAIRNLEARLDDISAQLDASAMKFAGVDRSVIRSLEKQVASLSIHLSKPAQPLPELEDLGPRLDEMERSISKSRDTIVETAREAAENAVRSYGGNAADSAAVAALADDLKSLDLLSRQADERNTKTFEAIHDTLLKIVERLGSLEIERQRAVRPQAMAQPVQHSVLHTLPQEPERKPTVADAPSIAPSMSMESPLAGDPDFGKTRPEFAARRTPAEAAAAAAVAAMDDAPQPEQETSSRVRSMLGGLTRKFAKKERVEPVMAEAPAAIAETAAEASVLDQPIDPKLANRPLEPGSGAPDLSAIMRRVRDERGQPVRHSESETAKSDFIAAARRAAQAAAAEADIVKRGTDGGTGKASGVGGLFGLRRKPVLLAAVAILVALAGLQLGKAFLRGDRAVASVEEPTVIEDTSETNTAAVVPMTNDGTDEPIAADTTGMADDAGEPIEGDTVASTDEPVDGTPRSVRQAEPVRTAAIAEEAAPIEEEVVAEPAAPLIQPVPAEAGPLALRQAAEQGDAKALFEVGSRYAEGRGVKENMAEAAKWYERSAELGLAPAQYRIGNFYEKGMGVERDAAKAKTWYQMAAEQGNASAMHNLAVLFAMGAGGTTDNDSAGRWFLEAAELGVRDSQFNLGILAAKGIGMEQNLEESYKWFALVAKAGDKDAAVKRDEIANALRPEQLTKARAATELWKARPVKPEANTVDVPDAWREGSTTTASVDMRQAVRNIQLILNKNGYDAGSADGVMGDKTKSAIAAFQKANGMEPTGEVDEILVKALLEKK
jgi:localization factor PodJL